MKDKDGCFDVNECLEKKSPCDSKAQFCVNNEGSYNCLDCDRSCDGCEGDGPDMCVRCKDGFELRNGICTGMSIFSVDLLIFTACMTVSFGIS